MSDFRIFSPTSDTGEVPQTFQKGSWWIPGVAISITLGLLFAWRIPQSATGTDLQVRRGTNESGLSQQRSKVSPDECLLIDDFNGDIQNRLGGYRNVFFRSPSSAMTRRERGDASNSSSPTGRGRMLRISGRRAEAGFCGAWVHLFDMRSRRPVYFDASSWNYLTFWIRGASGGEAVRFKAADLRWYRKEDARAIGQCDEFLPNGITTNWQQVVIPREKLAGLDVSKLASISFEFNEPGEQTVFIDDVCFKQSPELLPIRKRETADFDAVTRLTSQPKPRAMWILSTAELIRNKVQCEELFQACQQDNISLLWVQLPYKLHEETESSDDPYADLQFETRFAEESFSQFHSYRGLAIHSWESYRVKHPQFLGKAVPPASRFADIRRGVFRH